MTITANDLKQHLNLTADDAPDDAFLTAKIDAATAWIFAFIGETPDPVPAPVLEAIRQLAAHLFENREATLVGISADAIPFGVHDLIAPYRTWSF